MTTYPACVRCGYCCQKATCAMGYEYGAKDDWLCKFLDGDTPGFYRCLLVVNNPDLKEALSIGEGCSSPMFNTQREQALKNRRESPLTIRKEDG